MVTAVTAVPEMMCFSGQWQAGVSSGDTVYSHMVVMSLVGHCHNPDCPRGLAQKGLQDTLRWNVKAKTKVHLECSGLL